MPQAAPHSGEHYVTRVRVFVDFWNYELSMKAVEPGFRTDWRALGPGLVSEAARVINAVGRSDYQGMNVYGSYDDGNPNDRGLRRWATTGARHFSGCACLARAAAETTVGPEMPLLPCGGPELSRMRRRHAGN